MQEPQPLVAGRARGPLLQPLETGLLFLPASATPPCPFPQPSLTRPTVTVCTSGVSVTPHSIFEGTLLVHQVSRQLEDSLVGVCSFLGGTKESF